MGSVCGAAVPGVGETDPGIGDVVPGFGLTVDGGPFWPRGDCMPGDDGDMEPFPAPPVPDCAAAGKNINKLVASTVNDRFNIRRVIFLPRSLGLRFMTLLKPYACLAHFDIR